MIPDIQKVTDGMGFQPIEVSTPATWYVFLGRQIGKTTFGMAAAVNPRFWAIGFEVLTRNPGIAVMIGPVWLAVVKLRRSHSQSAGKQ